MPQFRAVALDSWRYRIMDTLLQDIRCSLRQMCRNPGFSVIAIATLALGIGGITAMFSAVDTILIRPLPYAAADRLVTVARDERFHAAVHRVLRWERNCRH